MILERFSSTNQDGSIDLNTESRENEKKTQERKKENSASTTTLCNETERDWLECASGRRNFGCDNFDMILTRNS